MKKPPLPVRNKLGYLAEGFAIKLLKSKDYKIIDRNFRSRFGEIDIIATKNDALVFVEVKARSSGKFGTALESVDYWKLLKIKKTAEYYLTLHSHSPSKLRIEVVDLKLSQGKVVDAQIINVD